MKRFKSVIAVLLFIVNITFAHDYQTVYSDRVAYFQDENKTVHCIKIDSVNFDGDSIFYPMNNLQLKDFNILCPNPKASSWFTNKIIIRKNENLLINSNNDTSYIKTNSELGDQWEVCNVNKYSEKFRIFAKHTNTSYENILGVMDSVKYFKLTVEDSTNPNSTHLVNNQYLILSKNHGLIQTIGFSYITNLELGFQNLNNPQLKLIGTNSINNSFQNFTTFDIFNFEIGDEFQIKRISQIDYMNDTYYIFQNVLEKSQNNDSVFYKIKTKTIHYYYEYKNLISTETSEEILSLKLGRLNHLESFSGQILFDDRDEKPYYAYNVAFYNNNWIKKLGDYTFIKNQQDDSCWTVDNSITRSTYYISGAGGPYYTYSKSSDENFSYLLVYYKKGNKTWGKPLIMTYIDNEFADIQIDVYPNPSANFLNITLPDLEKQFQITLIDLNSNIVLEQKLTNDQNKLDISSLSNGMYIYRIFVNNSEIKTGKIIKNDLFR